MIHEGNLQITEDNSGDFATLVSVTGDLHISSKAKLDALKTVGGNLYIDSDTKLEALTTVGGFLCIYRDVELIALKIVGGDLCVYGEARLETPQLTTIGGYLSILSEAKLDAPQLKTVGRDLRIYNDTKLNALTTVGGDLSISIGTNLYAPNAKFNSKKAKQICNNALKIAFKKEKGGTMKKSRGQSRQVGQAGLSDSAVRRIVDEQISVRVSDFVDRTVNFVITAMATVMGGGLILMLLNALL